MAGMNSEQMREYFVDLGMGKSLVDRGVAVAEEISKLLAEPVEHVFVSEYRDDGGNRYYENLWLFTERYVSEAQSFIGSDVFDVVPVRLGLARIEVSHEHFDFDTPSEQSRLAVGISFSTSGSAGITGQLKASGENCAMLSTILRVHLMKLLRGE